MSRVFAVSILLVAIGFASAQQIASSQRTLMDHVIRPESALFDSALLPAQKILFPGLTAEKGSRVVAGYDDGHVPLSGDSGPSISGNPIGNLYAAFSTPRWGVYLGDLYGTHKTSVHNGGSAYDTLSFDTTSEQISNFGGSVAIWMNGSSDCRIPSISLAVRGGSNTDRQSETRGTLNPASVTSNYTSHVTSQIIDATMTAMMPVGQLNYVRVSGSYGSWLDSSLYSYEGSPTSYPRYPIMVHRNPVALTAGLLMGNMKKRDIVAVANIGVRAFGIQDADVPWGIPVANIPDKKYSIWFEGTIHKLVQLAPGIGIDAAANATAQNDFIALRSSVFVHRTFMELLRRDNSEVFWSLSMPVTVKWNPLPSLAVFARIAPSVSGDYLSRHDGTTSTPEYSVITTNVNRVNVIARYAFSDRFSVALQPTFASSVGLAALEGTYRF